jgi:hypothetical protein
LVVMKIQLAYLRSLLSMGPKGELSAILALIFLSFLKSAPV